MPASRAPSRHYILGAFVVLAFASAVVRAQPAPDASTRELLNSERIESTFGSYGIEILEDNGAVRVSNLYSLEAGRRICRTFAIVEYPATVDAAIAAEHAAIVAGGSVGVTFAARGWSVIKVHRYIGEIGTPPRLAELMGGIEEQRLAAHVYDLEVERQGARFEYATIAEIHHPAYLDVVALRAIYAVGLALATRPDETAERLLEYAARASAAAERSGQPPESRAELAPAIP